MKTNCLILVLTLLCMGWGLQAQGFRPQYNENIELMCISARLAGYQEFSAEAGGSYIQDIRTHFDSFTSHPFIDFMRELRATHHVAYDAVASMGIRLVREGVTFTLVEEEEGTPGLTGDARWKDVDLEAFLKLLGQFYQESRFGDFFAAHKELYEQGVKVYEEQVLDGFHTDWYPRFYGKAQSEDFTLVICFNNGNGNYGPNRHVKGQAKEVFAIVSYAVDEAGQPAYNKNYLSTLVHEFNHSFINYLMDRKENANALENNGFFLFMSAQNSMRAQAYSHWVTMINESLVRAAVICYMMEYDQSQTMVQNLLLTEVALGFRWTPELVVLLRQYQQSRDQYPSFESFFPKVVEFFNEYGFAERARIKSPWSGE